MSSLLEREVDEWDVFGMRSGIGSTEQFTVRETVRAVIINAMGNVALVNASFRRIHLLVGGGVENGEDHIQALRREVLEEAGCTLGDEIENIGIIRERRDVTRQLYVSHCYIARAEDMGTPHYTLKERLQGCKLEWAQDISTARELLAADRPWDYRAHFVSFRDRLLLKSAQDVLKDR